MPKIHQTAIVDSKAQLADDVEVGPFSIIGPDVKIGPGTKILSHACVQGYTTIGSGNVIHPFVSIGSEPQDYGFKGIVSYVKIGDRNTFREGFTVNPGTKAESETVIGNDCFFMINSHVAHNCRVGNRVIMVNAAGISGYVELGDNCIISGLSGIHQFCRVGRFAMLSGGSTISMDLPPFMIGDGRNGSVKGVNVVGLKRNGFSEEAVKTIREMYKIFFKGGLITKNALEKIEKELPQLPEVREFVDFVRSSKRGVLISSREGRRS